MAAWSSHPVGPHPMARAATLGLAKILASHPRWTPEGGGVWQEWERGPANRGRSLSLRARPVCPSAPGPWEGAPQLTPAAGVPTPRRACSNTSAQRGWRRRCYELPEAVSPGWRVRGVPCLRLPLPPCSSSHYSLPFPLPFRPRTPPCALVLAGLAEPRCTLASPASLSRRLAAIATPGWPPPQRRFRCGNLPCYP